MRSLTHKEGLGKVVSEAEAAPRELENAAPSATAPTRHDRLRSEYHEKNGGQLLLTIFLMARLDS